MDERLIERRKGPRPKPGDLKTCSACGGTMQFTERYVLSDGRVWLETAAWLCLEGRCGRAELVRATEV